MAGPLLKCFVAQYSLRVEKKCEGVIAHEGTVGRGVETCSNDTAQRDGKSHLKPVSVKQGSLVDQQVLQPYFCHLVWSTK